MQPRLRWILVWLAITSVVTGAVLGVLVDQVGGSWIVGLIPPACILFVGLGAWLSVRGSGRPGAPSGPSAAPQRLTLSRSAARTDYRLHRTRTTLAG